MSRTTVSADDVTAIILAAGRGDRLSAAYPKQYIKLGDQDDPDRTVLDLLLTGYEAAKLVGHIKVVCSEEYLGLAESITARYVKVRDMVIGGETRHDSVRLGVESVATRFTVLHDAARPLLDEQALDACFEKIRGGSRAVNTVHHPSASMAVCSVGGPVSEIVERDQIAHGLCPVIYYTEDLAKGFALSTEQGLAYRDEPAMMRDLLPEVTTDTVEGHRSGFKLTFPEDLDVLAAHRRQIELRLQTS